MLYAAVFIGTVVSSTLGYKTYSLIGFAILLISIITLIFIAALTSANPSKKPKILECNGRLQDYKFKCRKKNSNGYMVDYYTIRFLYYVDGETKECETLETYHLEQIKYLSSLENNVPLNVCKNYCEIRVNIADISDDTPDNPYK